MCSMYGNRRLLLATVFSAVVFVSTPDLSAQLNHLPWILKYNTGQNIQPIFHGWARNPDDSFMMHFGYLNRNYVESLNVPVGVNNGLELSGLGLDQGQPTYFYPRFHNFAFSVQVPSDWGERELVWSVTIYGRTDQAVAWLQPEWEISDPTASSRARQASSSNQSPTINNLIALPVTLPDAATLTTSVSDDGLPQGQPEVRELAVGQETPPTLLPGPGSVQSPINLPQLPPAPDRTTARQLADPRPEGVSVSWIVWRGPAGASFDPIHSAATNGQTTTTANFTIPGTYVLRATATDRSLSTSSEVSVTVRDP